MAAPSIYIPLLCGVAVLLVCGSAVLCAPQSLAGDFDSQLQHILQEQMLSPQDPVITRALDDVRATLDQRWTGYELIVHGSLGSGLGTKASDIDLVMRLPNFNASDGLYVLTELKKLIKQQPELYARPKYRHNVPFVCSFFSFHHIPSGNIIEIESNPDAVYEYIQNAKVVKYYFGLDKKFKFLGVFLKYWFKIHDITGHGYGYLPGYGLYMLIIFYLQQKNMAPPGYMLQVNSTTHCIEGWNMDFNELPYNTTNTENLLLLLGGFFKYYSEFNFEEYIVTPYTGRPIPRNASTAIGKHPKECALHNNTSNCTKQNAILNICKHNWDSAIIVQDMFRHDENVAIRMSHKRVTKFKYLMKSTATMFEDLPSDKILSALLVK